MFSGLISIGGMGGGLFGNLSASLKPASKISKKSEQSLHAPVKRKTSSTESHKATKRKKYETSSHSRKRSDERRHRNGKRDKRSRSRSRHEKYGRDRRDDRNKYTATKQNITAAAASAHGSRTAFAFFQTNSKKVVVKKDQSSSDTVREPKNPFQFFMEYKNGKSVKTEADVVAARAEWNNLCDEAKGLFEDKADLDTKRCGVQLITLTRAQKLANKERLEAIKDLNERLQMTYIGRYVRKVGSDIHGRVMDIVKDTVEVKYEDGDSASIALSKINSHLLHPNWPDIICDSEKSFACSHCGKIFDTKTQVSSHQENQCLVFRIEVDEEKLAAAQAAAEFDDEDSQDEYDDTVDVTNGTASSQGERETKQNDDIKEVMAGCECPICFEVYTVPVNLPCGHTVCKECLACLTKNECCTCRKAFDREKDVRRNYALESVCNLLRKKEAAAAE